MSAPRWPSSAVRAIVHLFRDVQTLDVYVEDENDEIFYRELLRRALPGGATIERVFGLGNRAKVIEAAKAYSSDRQAVFIIDGDLQWVRGESVELPRLLVWDAYCVENIVATKEAGERILKEERPCSDDEAERLLAFDEWEAEMVTAFAPLFAVFALRATMSSPPATVSEGYRKYLGSNGPSKEKIRLRISELSEEMSQRMGSSKVDLDLASINQHISRLEVPSRVISGKDFLLPLLCMKIKTLSDCRAPVRALRHRMALHCDPARLRKFTNMVIQGR